MAAASGEQPEKIDPTVQGSTGRSSGCSPVADPRTITEQFKAIQNASSLNQDDKLSHALEIASACLESGDLPNILEAARIATEMTGQCTNIDENMAMIQQMLRGRIRERCEADPSVYEQMIVSLQGAGGMFRPLAAVDAIANLIYEEPFRSRRANGDAVRFLTHMLESSDACEASLAAVALSALVCERGPLQDLAVKEGAIPGLVKLMQSEDTEVLASAAMTLRDLVCESGRALEVYRAGVLPPLAGALRCTSPTMVKYTVPLFVQIFRCSADAPRDAVIAGCIPAIKSMLRDPPVKIELPPTVMMLPQKTRKTWAAMLACDMMKIAADFKDKFLEAGMLGLLLGMVGSSEERGEESRCAIAAIKALASGHADGRSLGAVLGDPANVLVRCIEMMRCKDDFAVDQSCCLMYELCLCPGKVGTPAVEAGALPVLAQLLRSEQKEIRGTVAIILMHIAQESDELAEAAVQAGVLPSLVSMLRTEDVAEMLDAAGAITGICSGPPDATATKQAVVDAGALPILVHLCDAKDQVLVEQAVGALLNVSNGGRTLATAVVNAGALPRFVACMRTGVNNAAQRSAMACVRILQVSDALKQAALEAGVIAGLVDLLGSQSAVMVSWAATGVVAATTDSSSMQKAAMQAGAIPRLVRLLGTHAEGTQLQQTVHEALTAVCKNNRAGMEQAASEGALPKYIDLLQSCSGRNQTQVVMLLLRSMCASEQLAIDAIKAGLVPAAIRTLEAIEDKDQHIVRVIRLLLSGATGGVQEEVKDGSFRCGGSMEGVSSMQRAIVSTGSLPSVLRLLRSNDPVEVETGAGVLMNLARGPEEVRKAVVDAGSIPELVLLLSTHEDGLIPACVAAVAGAVVFNLANMSAEGKHAAKEAAAEDAFARLVDSNDGQLASIAQNAVCLLQS